MTFSGAQITKDFVSVRFLTIMEPANKAIENAAVAQLLKSCLDSGKSKAFLSPSN